jgi:hypothetical protein
MDASKLLRAGATAIGRFCRLELGAEAFIRHHLPDRPVFCTKTVTSGLPEANAKAKARVVNAEPSGEADRGEPRASRDAGDV